MVAALAGALAAAAPPPGAPAPAIGGEARAPGFAGSWEGEAETAMWPLFLNLRIERTAGGLAGTLAVLGQEVKLEQAPAAPDLVQLRSGTGEGALSIEGRLQGGHLVGRLRQGKDVLPFALRPIRSYPPAADRLEKWRQDLDTLRQRFLPVDRSFSRAERALFLERIEAIEQDLPRLGDAQVTMRIAAALATAGNAHTRLYILRNRTELRRLPIRLWWFSDGLRVVRATTAYRDLLGCRVAHVAGLDPRVARDMVAPAFAGSPGWTDYMSVYALTSPEALHGMGVTPALETVRYGFDDCKGADPARAIAPLPLARSAKPVEAWWDLSPEREPAAEGWAHVLDGAGAPPLYLRNPNDHYWSEFVPERGLLYVQYNRSAEMEGKPIAAFADALAAEFERREVRALVIDLRFNTGGNLNLAAAMMKRLETLSRGLPRFVITGRATFSAGISHVAFWREAGNVTLVGEPVGDEMDFWAEGGNIILPNSGLAAHFANGAHSYSDAPCPTPVPCLDMKAPPIRPDVPVAASWADYRSRKDPALAAVLASLARPR
ncbi:MAG TPA: hypothetical protein VD846_00555 [Allosphingosinicella sp.]|nr:hypothetical protein [Allosphingosinicella sp.]